MLLLCCKMDRIQHLDLESEDKIGRRKNLLELKSLLEEELALDLSRAWSRTCPALLRCLRDDASERCREAAAECVLTCYGRMEGASLKLGYVFPVLRAKLVEGEKKGSAAACDPTLTTFEEELSSILADGVRPVESDLVMPTPSEEENGYFLSRWLDPDDGEGGATVEVVPEDQVLEAHGFDASLRTGDLARDLRAHRGAFDLRWVDDNHALLVFR